MRASVKTEVDAVEMVLVTSEMVLMSDCVSSESAFSWISKPSVKFVMNRPRELTSWGHFNNNSARVNPLLSLVSREKKSLSECEVEPLDATSIACARLLKRSINFLGYLRFRKHLHHLNATRPSQLSAQLIWLIRCGKWLRLPLDFTNHFFSIVR